MKDLLTVDEVAEILRTTPKAVRRMKEDGKLPGVVKTLGRRILVRRVDLLRSLGLLDSALSRAS